MSKILISNVEIVTDGPDYAKKFIGIDGNKIAYIGTEKPKGYKNAYQIDGSGKLAAAGMPVISFSSRTSCQELRASRKLI